ncbi:hypothetical protein FT663_00332 [Candidozyma haemuli var. vulneris]|nr:hypothetical protein FT662_00802 [[Candida] haemuloni var. vulneris]KAF3995585.1 hypothetical protein FT663_00332 [[Candida] haemuloni var. vulneris]
MPYPSLLIRETMIHRILGNIFLSSIEDVDGSVDLQKEYGITHVVSVLEGSVPQVLKEKYQHLQIEVQDLETSNLLEHFNTTNEFIDSALVQSTEEGDQKKHHGAVLVHCAQGVSRSVAVVMAYLMYKYKLKIPQALHAVKRRSESAQPNEGFMKQLELFQEMAYSVDKSSSAYRQFLVESSLQDDPSGQSLASSEIFSSNDSKERAPGSYHLRCKRCRKVLANQGDIETHEMPGTESRQSQFIKTAPNSRRIVAVADASKTCSHYFLDEPVDWMRAELEKQDIEGKFSCPKCSHKVGGYSWKGSRCSCGKWMVPALHLQTAKVDEMKTV